jgi:hypothetical protein
MQTTKGAWIIEENDMSSKKKILIVFKLIILFFSINFIFACAGNLFTFRGAWVKEENRVSLLEGGPHRGRWETRDISIEYKYRKVLDDLKISGIVDLANYIKTGYNTLDHLYLYVYFLEADGTVLDTKVIRIFGYRQWFVVLRNRSFDHRLELPEGTVDIAFGYRGKVSEGGGGGRIEWDFWKTPRRKPPE